MSHPHGKYLEVINTIMTYSYLPKGMSDNDFLDLKINWLIKNDKVELLENFLNKNENFKGKKKIIQYLVEKNIAMADLKKGCEKCNFKGYMGRTTVCELLMITDEVKPLILQKADAGSVKRLAMKQGMVTLRQNAVEKIFRGLKF